MTRKTRYPEIAPRDRQIAFAVRGRDLQDSEKFRSGRQALLTEQWHNVKHAARRSRREFGTSYRHKAVRGRDLPGNVRLFTANLGVTRFHAFSGCSP